MKIAILTMVFNNNTGGMLQAFALQHYLINKGHTVSILDVRATPKPTKIRRLLRLLKRFTLKYIFCKNIYSISYNKEMSILERNTRYFIDKYMIMTETPFYKKEDFYKIDVDKFNAYIVGSDQVWRPTMYPFINEAFFCFVKNKIIKKIAYAASFGVDYWEYTAEQTLRFKSQINEFEAISVRESSGVELCRSNFDVEAQHVIDPTMLLFSDDYIKLVKDENEPSHAGELMVYLLDKTECKLHAMHAISKYFGYRTFETTVKSKKYAGSISDCIYPTVTSWLRGFMDAKYIFTDSFHGCVFAILFNIPFIAYGNKERGLTRFDSLLKMFGLENRLILDESELTISKLSLPINWDIVNEILDNERDKAKAFITEALIQSN